MKNFLKFILVGVFFAGLVEFLRIGIASGKVNEFISILFVVYPVFLTFVYFSSKLIGYFTKNKMCADLTYFILYGFIWLMLEWFVMNLAPWNNYSDNFLLIPLIVFFQIGMFLYGATVSFAPHIFTAATPSGKTLRRVFIIFYIPFFLVAYVITIITPPSAKFPVAIILTIIGHLILGIFYIRYFVREWRREKNLKTV